jgi:c-di-GMP-related signal transduction protein
MTADRSDLFFMGLLSVTDALLDMPIKRVLAGLPVSEEVRQALSEQKGRFNDIYDTVLSYERGDWSQLTATLAGRIDAEEHVPACYIEATKRASQVAV